MGAELDMGRCSPPLARSSWRRALAPRGLRIYYKQTCAKIPKRSKIQDPLDPRSGIQVDLRSSSSGFVEGSRGSWIQHFRLCERSYGSWIQHCRFWQIGEVGAALKGVRGGTTATRRGWENDARTECAEWSPGYTYAFRLNRQLELR